MPRTRKRRPQPEQIEQQEEEHLESEVIENSTARPLQFDEPLTWRSGKPTPVADLLRRLKVLSDELVNLDQEDADRATLVPKAQELVHTQLLDHRDKGVKAYTMLCIVEMFRLLAPDAPYKGGQLKHIFSLFISNIVPALANPTDPYNQLHNAILGSLSTVKSIVLLTDIPGSDNMILDLFANCFDVMSGEMKGASGDKLPKNLEHRMTSLLCTLVDETTSLPPGVTEVILAQFLRADPQAVSLGNKKGELRLQDDLNEPSPAYSMAVAVCNTCADKMSLVIAHYFSSVLVDATQALDSAIPDRQKGSKRAHGEFEDEDERLDIPGEEDLREAEKAHRLLREMWRATPDITRNVIPQMEAELRTETPQLRSMAVQAVGDMIAGIGAAGPPPPPTLDPAAYPSQSTVHNEQSQIPSSTLRIPSAPIAFSSAHPVAYQAFTDRYKDKDWQVRSAFVTAIGRILLTSAGGRGLSSDHEEQLLGYFSDLLVDVDDRVRLAAIQMLNNFGYHGVVHTLGRSGGVNTTGSLLGNLSDRIKDRKHNIRTAAMELLARLWGVAYGAIADGDERVRGLLGAIPMKIFDAMYLNEPSVSAYVQRVLFDSLLPVTFPPIKSKATGTDPHRANGNQQTAEKALDPDSIRARRILVLVEGLEKERSKKIFFALQQRQPEIAKYLEAFLKTSEALHSGLAADEEKAKRKQLDDLVRYLSERFTSDSTKATEQLKSFSKFHDRRSYQLIRFCYSPESDHKKIVRAMKELTKRLETTPGGISTVLETLMPLVRSASVLIYNKSHVPAIVEISRTNLSGLSTTALTLLRDISARAPGVFRIHVQELCETLQNKVPAGGATSDADVVETFKACAGFARRFPDGMPKERDFFKAMVKFATQSSDPKAAKHAVTVIVSCAEKKEMYVKEILKSSVDEFQYNGQGYLAKLASMSQLRLMASSMSNSSSKKIETIAIEEVLKQTRTIPGGDDPSWADIVDDDLTAKLLALRILVNELRGRSYDQNTATENSKQDIIDAAAPTYKLLNTLIDCEGELETENSTPKFHKSRLRLAAAIHLLKLSRNRMLDGLLAYPDFDRLSKIIQDPIPEVRRDFLKALKKNLSSGDLPARFYALPFLYAFEPDRNTKDTAISFLKLRAAAHARAGDTVMEATFARFCSLLAHHPDFSTDTQDLEDFSEYVLFYLKNVATESNLPMIYYIAQRLKSVQDGIHPEKSENLYIISDLAEAVIRQFQEMQGWALQLFPGKLSLPNGLFARLPSHAAAQDIAEKRYLPTSFVGRLEDVVKALMKTKKRKSESSSTQLPKRSKTSMGKVDSKKLVSKTSTQPSKSSVKKSRTPKSKRGLDLPSSERRKSMRGTNARNYAEGDSSDDDDELEQWQDEDEAEEDEVEDEAADEVADEDENQSEKESHTSTPVGVDRKHSSRSAAGGKAGARTSRTSNPVAQPASGRPLRNATRSRKQQEPAEDRDGSDENRSDLPNGVID